MEDLSINEQNIKKLANSTKANIECAQKLLDKMLDDKTDLFARYLSFNKLRVFNRIVTVFMPMTTNILISGHNIGHPFLQTEKAKECGWTERTLEQDPFFESPNGKTEESRIEDFLRNMLTE